MIPTPRRQAIRLGGHSRVRERWQMNNPSDEMYDEISGAYAFFNDRLFAGQLPGCLFTLQRKSHTFGYYSPSRFLRRNGNGKSDELALNPAYFAHRRIEQTLSTLVHEQVHQWQAYFGKPSRSGYHNAEWANKMEAVGLMPSNTGEPGGARHGQQMTHYIIEGGPFDVACKELLASGGMLSWIDIVAKRVPMSPALLYGPGGEPSEPEPVDPTIDIEALTSAGLLQPATPKDDPKNKRKYLCPNCKLQVWGKPGLSGLIGCMACELAMIDAKEFVEVEAEPEPEAE